MPNPWWLPENIDNELPSDSTYSSAKMRELSALVQPQPTADNLDGVTRETLVEAEIAKHKEVLTPETQPPAATVAALNLISVVQQSILEELTKIRIELSEFLKELRDVPIEDPETGTDHAGRSPRQEVLEENGHSANRGEGLRRGRQESGAAEEPGAEEVDPT